MKRSPRRHRGTVLIVTMLVTFALAGMVIVLCRSMRVEMLASANLAASMQAAAVERGAEQYVLGVLTDQGEAVGDLTEDQFSAIPVGDGVFWILRPQYDDDQLPVFGLSDEAGKINVNASSFDQISRLPGMTFTAASSLMDWIDVNDRLERDGAENEYYLSLDEPYYCKNGPMETVEEVLLIRGFDRAMLYGDGTAPPLGQRTSTLAPGTGFTDPQIARGLYDILTIYSAEPRTASGSGPRVNITSRSRLRDLLRQRFSAGRAEQMIAALAGARPSDIFDLYFRAKLTPEEFDSIVDSITTLSGNGPIRGRINVNTAPRQVLLCLNNLEDADVDKLLAQRRTASQSPASIAWVAQALGPKAVGLEKQITTHTYQYTADILAVSGNGRAFKRCRIVVDMQSGTPQIIYRRDLGERGWPMDPQILASLRAGQGVGQWSTATMAGGSF